MATNDQSTLKKYYKETPKVVQELLVSDVYSDTIEHIAREYSIREKASLENEITLLLLGLRDPDTFNESLAEELECDVRTAGEIMDEVDDSLFIPFVEDEEVGLQILSDLKTAQPAQKTADRPQRDVSREEARKALLEKVSGGGNGNKEGKQPLADTPSIAGNEQPQKTDRDQISQEAKVPVKSEASKDEESKENKMKKLEPKEDGESEKPKSEIPHKQIPVKESTEPNQKEKKNGVLGGDLIDEKTETPPSPKPEGKPETPQKEEGRKQEKNEQKIPYKVEEKKGPTTDLEGIEITQQPRDGGYGGDDDSEAPETNTQNSGSAGQLSRDDVLAQIEDLDRSEQGQENEPKKENKPSQQPKNEVEAKEPAGKQPANVPQKNTSDDDTEKKYDQGQDPYREPVR